MENDTPTCSQTTMAERAARWSVRTSKAVLLTAAVTLIQPVKLLVNVVAFAVILLGDLPREYVRDLKNIWR